MTRSLIISNCHLASAMVCWVIFAFLAFLAFLMVDDRAVGLDRWGLLVLRDAATLELRGPKGLADAARDVTALGGLLAIWRSSWPLRF